MQPIDLKITISFKIDVELTIINQKGDKTLFKNIDFYVVFHFKLI